MMKVLVKSRLKKSRLDAVAAGRFAKRVMRRLKVPHNAELSVLFTGGLGIRRLNRRYRRTDAETDVLAFPMGATGDVRGEGAYPLGDVVISADEAIKNSTRFGTDPDEELFRCLAHGILHLCGFGDERAEDRERMIERQELLLGDILKSGRWRIIKRR